MTFMSVMNLVVLLEEYAGTTDHTWSVFVCIRFVCSAAVDDAKLSVIVLITTVT